MLVASPMFFLYDGWLSILYADDEIDGKDAEVL